MRDISKELNFHFRDSLLNINVILHLNHEESQSQTEIECGNTQNDIDKSCPPTQPPWWENGDCQRARRNEFRICFIHRFNTEHIISGRYICIRGNAVFAVIMPFFLVSFEYVAIRYPILVIEI